VEGSGWKEGEKTSPVAISKTDTITWVGKLQCKKSLSKIKDHFKKQGENGDPRSSYKRNLNHTTAVTPGLTVMNVG